MQVNLTPSQIERFWSHVQKSDDCWLWQGAHHPAGYGEFVAAGRKWRAHRLSYMLLSGLIPPGLWVLHHCDTPACCRPEHLFIGTVRDNNADMWAKGRACADAANLTPFHPQPGERNGSARLTAEQVLEIRRLWAQRGITQIELGHRFGVDNTTIHLIVHRKKWAHLP